MKILKEGKLLGSEPIVKTCPRCKTEFECVREDILPFTPEPYVQCPLPGCGQEIELP